MQTTGVNYYSVLGVSPNSTASDIKQKYRELSKKYHPDTMGGDTARMSLINEAYAVLSNPLKRRKYEPFVPKPKTSAPTYQKSQAQPQRSAAKPKETVQDEEPENGWYVFLSYVLAVPVAILIVSVGWPMFQKILPKADSAATAQTQTTKAATTNTSPPPQSTNATTNPNVNTQPTTAAPATTTEQTVQQIDELTDEAGDSPRQNNNRSNFYYEFRSRQSNNN